MIAIPLVTPGLVGRATIIATRRNPYNWELPVLIPEPILSAIVEAIFGYLLDQSGLMPKVREKLGRDPAKRAYARALNNAITEFQKQHPSAEDRLFDPGFLQKEAAPLLAQFLLRDGRPDPHDLANAWADSLGLRDPERRATATRELAPIAADFLALLGHALKAQPDLADLNNSRAVEDMISHLTAIRGALDAQPATRETRDRYLHWLIERTLYLDPRGTFQTQHQVQVELDEVYISLQAQREELLAQLLGGVISGAGPGKPLKLSKVVTRSKRLVVLGDPGSGKTTLAHYLAFKHAQALHAGRRDAGNGLGPTHFPILIRIADYAENETWKHMPLSEFLSLSCKLLECPATGLAELLQSELDLGACLILLDGLDEIVSTDARRDIVRRIEDFVRRYDSSGNRFVITSRIAGYRTFPLSEPFDHYTIQEMSEKQIRRFLHRWCNAVEAAQTPDLSPERRAEVAKREIDGIVRAIKNLPGVRRMAANPLLLRVLALIHRTNARLPQKRIELYKLAADTLARDWRVAQGVSETALALLEEPYLTRLLRRLAYWLHVTQPTGLASEREVIMVLGEEWASIKRLDWDGDDPNPEIIRQVDQFLRAVREHTGLFVERAPKRYGFMHLTFQEYYVARYLVARAKTRVELIRRHLHDPHWDEPILLALGFVGVDSPEDASELVEGAILAQGEDSEEYRVTASPYEYLLGRDFLFALRCLGNDIPVDPKVTLPLVRRLVDELVRWRNSGKYRRYREMLWQRLEALKDTDIAPIMIDELKRSLVDSEAKPQVRCSVVLALSELGPCRPDQVLPFMQVALADPNPNVRAKAVQGLSKLGPHRPDRVLPLMQAALADPDPLVYAQVIQGLWKLGMHVPDRVPPNLASASIKYTGTLIKYLGEVVSITSGHISGNFTDTDVHWRAIARLVHKELPSNKFESRVIEGLQKAQHWAVRCDFADLLSESLAVNDAIINALYAGLLDSNHEVRTSCAQALARLGRRFPAAAQQIAAGLELALSHPAFDMRPWNARRTGHDYAFDALWMLVVEDGLEDVRHKAPGRNRVRIVEL